MCVCPQERPALVAEGSTASFQTLSSVHVSVFFALTSVHTWLACDFPASPQASSASGSFLTDWGRLPPRASADELHFIDKSSGASSCSIFVTTSNGGKSGNSKGVVMPRCGGWSGIAESESVGDTADGSGNPSVWFGQTGRKSKRLTPGCWPLSRLSNCNSSAEPESAAFSGTGSGTLAAMLRRLALAAVVEDSFAGAAAGGPGVIRFGESEVSFLGSEKLFSAVRFFGAF